MTNAILAQPLERFCLKFYTVEREGFDLAELIPTFHRWIQTRAVEGLLIDVVDYRHVPNGPGVVLIGHEADYSMDRAEGLLGLLYNRKRSGQGSVVERLRDALKRTLSACRLLEEELAGHGLRFDGRGLRFIANDRLAAPNDDETLADLLPDLKAAIGPLYPGQGLEIVRDESDPRSRLTVHVRSSKAVWVESLLERV